MVGARECCHQIRCLLSHEYTKQLLLTVSGWFAWSPKKNRLINGGRKRCREQESGVVK
jgi:hypothetical protein